MAGTPRAQGGLIFLVALLVLTLVVTTREDATNMETGLWTFILFAVGFGASYYFGRSSVQEAARELVRQQAKAAARRLVTLGAGFSSVRQVMDHHRHAAQATAEEGDGDVPLADVRLAYKSVEIHVELQKRMVIDALEDWRHFDPEIVNELIEEDGSE